MMAGLLSILSSLLSNILLSFQTIAGGQPGWALSPWLAVLAAHALGPVAAHVARVPAISDFAAPPEQGIA